MDRLGNHSINHTKPDSNVFSRMKTLRGGRGALALTDHNSSKRTMRGGIKGRKKGEQEKVMKHMCHEGELFGMREKTARGRVGDEEDEQQ